jgi:hypothetical protein
MCRASLWNKKKKFLWTLGVSKHSTALSWLRVKLQYITFMAKQLWENLYTATCHDFKSTIVFRDTIKDSYKRVPSTSWKSGCTADITVCHHVKTYNKSCEVWRSCWPQSCSKKLVWCSYSTFCLFPSKQLYLQRQPEYLTSPHSPAKLFYPVIHFKVSPAIPPLMWRSWGLIPGRW